MILSSRLSLLQANTGKLTHLSDFIDNYRLAIEFYVDYLWSNYVILQKLNIPAYIPSIIKPLNTDLSARALKCAATQACAMVKSRTKALAKKQYIIKKNQRIEKHNLRQKKSKKHQDIRKLQATYDRYFLKLKKPKTHNVYPELNSICCNYLDKQTNHFDGIIVLSSIGKKYGKVAIPIKKHKQFNELSSLGKQMTSFIVTNNVIDVRFDIPEILKEVGNIEGADQGMRTCLTISDGQTTKKCNHGHDLHSICKSISRKKKGSKAFKRKQRHRTNHVNWSIKQINLTDIQQLNLEKLRNMGKGKRVSRLLQSFSHKEIRTAIIKRCKLAGVQLIEQSSPYRSQRCNNCGFVHKSNRRGDVFTCKGCSYTSNADFNASMNHKASLCYLPIRFSHLPNRSTGFYWKSDGLFDVNGQEFTVPAA